MHFIKNVLVMDPKGRLSGEQALGHNYFEGLGKGSDQSNQSPFEN
jgi:hypothetical protein